MKKQLKKIIPNRLVEHFRLKKKTIIFKDKSINETFTIINKNKYWNSTESVSGNGSELAVTQELIKGLNQILNQKNITSILDIPCGDFNWMQHANLQNIAYLGCDIVEDLVISNNAKYGSNNKKFALLDLTNDILPKMDIIFCRDCLVHLSYKDIYKALMNIKKSKSEYLLITTFYKCNRNKNIITGQWRDLNFEKFPFYFKEPLQIIDEKYSKNGKKYSDKIMGLWKVSEIRIPFKLKLYYWLS